MSKLEQLLLLPFQNKAFDTISNLLVNNNSRYIIVDGLLKTDETKYIPIKISVIFILNIHFGGKFK